MVIYFQLVARLAKVDTKELLRMSVLEVGHLVGAKERRYVPAKDSPVQQTKVDSVFVRFSACRTDRRLMADGSWRDGTYAPTQEDAQNVQTGKQATDRYALPNPVPASYVFTGRPHQGTEIKMGVVAPAFNHRGGGIEVIFTKGTQANTVTGPRKIPDR